MAEPFYEIVQGKRKNKSVLQAGGFKYAKNRPGPEGIYYYKCQQRRPPHNCHGTGKLDMVKDVFYSLDNHTCHLPPAEFEQTLVVP